MGGNENELSRTSRGLFALCALFVCLGCRPSAPAKPVVTYPTTFLLPTVLHQGNDPIKCGCRGFGNRSHCEFAFGTLSGRVLITQGEELKVRYAGFSDVAIPQAIAIIGDRLIIGTSNERVVYDLSNKNRIWTETRKRSEWSLIAPYDEHRFFVESTETRIERIDLETMQPDFAFDQSQSQGGSSDHHRYDSLEVSPDKSLLAIGFRTGVSVVDIKTGQEKYFLQMPALAGFQVAFAPDSRMLYVAGNGVRAWDLTTGKMVIEKLSVPSDISTIAVSTSGKLIAIGETDAVGFPCHFCVLDDQLRLIYRFEAGITKLSYLAFRDNSYELITSSFGGDIKLWDLAGVAAGLAASEKSTAGSGEPAEAPAIR